MSCPYRSPPATAASPAASQPAVEGINYVLQVPSETKVITLALIGIQSDDKELLEEWSNKMARILEGVEGVPALVERMEGKTSTGLSENVWTCYWTDAVAYSGWYASNQVQALLGETELPAEVGIWIETSRVPPSHFQHAPSASPNSPLAPGITALFPRSCRVPSSNFGGWGNYRARLPGSDSGEKFRGGRKVPEKVERGRGTRGRVVTVKMEKEGICYIREVQGYAPTADKASSILHPLLLAWLSSLTADPAQSGCLSLRHLLETPTHSSQSDTKYSQWAYFLSLSHLEKASRTHPVHLELRDKFLEMAGRGEVGGVDLWVEVFILDKDGWVGVYNNCEEETGLLPWFEGEETSAVSAVCSNKK